MKTRIQEQAEIAVCVVSGGDICIEQKSADKTNPNKVFVSPESVARLCEILKTLHPKAVETKHHYYDIVEDMNGGI